MTSISRYIKLLVEDTRLGLAEKLTRMLSAVAVCAILCILALVAMLFITIGIAYMLQPMVSPVWAFMIVASFYVLLIVILLIFKRQLVVDPIARFVSSLIVEPPLNKTTAGNDKPTTIS